MNNVQRFREVLNLFDQGCRLKFHYGSDDDNDLYAMADNGKLGIIMQRTEPSKEPEEVLMAVDYSYPAWLSIVSDGMKEIHGDDMFDLIDHSFYKPPILCITTNGDLNKNGECVMGKGVAFQFKNLFPELPKRIGNYIQQYGNRVFNLGLFDYTGSGEHIPIRIMTFPTKHHWKEDSDINLIKKSCEEIIQVCDKYDCDTVFLPAPGVNNGRLNYKSTVEPIISLILDSRFYICFK